MTSDILQKSIIRLKYCVLAITKRNSLNNNNVNNNVNTLNNIKKEETFTTQPLLPIFLLVTSDETDFKPLQQCAVESACLHGGKFTELKIYNKNFNINKILTKFKTLNICQFKNLTFLPLNYEQIHRGLITEEWYRNKQWEIGFTSNNLSNAARLALLYKYGGVYIDTDYLILRDVTTLRNALAYEMNGTLNSMINNAFMVFNEKNNKFIEFALSTFVRGFNGKHWGYNGPHVFLRVYNQLKALAANEKASGPMQLAMQTATREEAKSILRETNIQTFEKIYPIPCCNRVNILYSDKYTKEDFNLVMNAYGVHLWNNLTKHNKLGKGQLLYKVMERACPSTLKEMMGLSNK
ncbi:hypothetical protein ABK040_013063 [Willaertia magna]